MVTPIYRTLTFLMLAVGLVGCGRDPVNRSADGIQSLNAGKPRKAVSQLEKAVGAWPSDSSAKQTSRVYEALALARFRADPDDPGVEAALREAVESNPDRFSSLYNLGVWMMDHNQPEEARRILKRAVEADTTRTEALEVLAAEALAQGDFTEAVDWLERARSRNETASVLTAWAVASNNTAPAAEIRKVMQRAVSLDPEYPPAQLNLAAILDQHRLDPEQAINHYENFLRLSPESPNTARVRQRIQIMATRLENGRFAQPDPIRREVENLLMEAKTVAERGNPRLALQNCLQANLKADRASRPDLKERALRAAATLVPDSPRGHYGLGRFLLDQGRKKDALNHLREAQRISPEWPPALVSTVGLALELGEREVARTALATSEESAGSNPGFLLQIGELYANELNSPRDARRVYKTWLDRFPNHPRLPEVEARL